MKKNQLFIILNCLLLLASCSKDEVVPSISENSELDANVSYSYKDSIPTTPNFSGGSNLPNNLVGYGYDATGLRFNPISARNQVIDIDKFKNHEPDRLIYSKATSSGQINTYAGNNGGDFLGNLTLSLDNSFYNISEWDLPCNLFSGELSRYFSSGKMITSKESYAVSDYTIQYSGVSLNSYPDQLSDYLTYQFTLDISSKSAEYIVEHYGTHVMTAVDLGAKIHYVYKSFVYSSSNDVDEVALNGLRVATKGYSAVVTSSLAEGNTHGYLSYETVGGDPTKGFKGQISTDSNVLSLDINSWIASIDSSNMQLIDVPNGNLLPIYDFVKDPALKLSLKNAVNQYISNSKISMVNELFRYINISTNEHRYTDNWRSFGNQRDGWRFENVAGYVYAKSNSAPNTIPLYGNFNNELANVLTTDIKELPSNYPIESSIIGYVFENQQPNTLPLYRYYNTKNNSYLFTTNQSEVQGNVDWALVRIECYVIKSIKI